MKNVENNTELRSEIRRLTATTIPTKHKRSIEELKQKFNHNIRLLSNPNFIDTTEDCFLYTMKHVLAKPDYEKLKGKLPNLGNFNDLINKGFLSLHDEYDNTDRVVVYFNENGVAHFGFIDGEKIRSKWGRGLIWEHSLFEVPIEYGNTVKFSDGSINSGS